VVSKKKWDELDQLLASISEEGISWNIFLYNTVIFELGKAGKLKEMLSFLKKMKEEGIEPDVVTYTSIIDVYGRRDDIERMMTVYKQMLSLDIIPNQTTLNLMLATFARLGKMEQMEHTIQTMKTHRFPLNIVAFNSVIDAYGKVGNIPKMHEYFELLKETNLIPNIMIHQSFLEAYGMAKQKDKMFHWFQLIRTNYFPNILNYCNVLRFSDFSDLDRLMDYMKEDGLRPNLSFYNGMLKFLTVKGLRKMQVVFNQMKADGIEPDATTYHTMIDGCYKSKENEACWNYYQEMKSKNYFPSRIDAMQIVGMLSNTPDPIPKIDRLFEDMKGSRTPLFDKLVLVAFCKAYAIHGVFRGVWDVIQYTRSLGMSWTVEQYGTTLGLLKNVPPSLQEKWQSLQSGLNRSTAVTLLPQVEAFLKELSQLNTSQ